VSSGSRVAKDFNLQPKQVIKPLGMKGIGVKLSEHLPWDFAGQWNPGLKLEPSVESGTLSNVSCVLNLGGLNPAEITHPKISYLFIYNARKDCKSRTINLTTCDEYVANLSIENALLQPKYTDLLVLIPT
jgi:hypothetical protein